jgi:protein phosphatase PTC7
LEAALLQSHNKLRTLEVAGGSTALLGRLSVTGVLTLLNLGDSGVLILRPSQRLAQGRGVPYPRVIFKSSHQTHHFNCPYQLGSEDPHVEAPDILQVHLRPGDIIVACTDGVFDNLFDHQVQTIVSRWSCRWKCKDWREGAQFVPVPQAELQGLATRIAEEAHFVGQQEDLEDIVTPFVLAAHSEGLAFRGGKLDDTTVVLGLVCEEQHTEESAAEQVFLHNFRNS